MFEVERFLAAGPAVPASVLLRTDSVTGIDAGAGEIVEAGFGKVGFGVGFAAPPKARLGAGFEIRGAPGFTTGTGAGFDDAGSAGVAAADDIRVAGDGEVLRGGRGDVAEASFRGVEGAAFVAERSGAADGLDGLGGAEVDFDGPIAGRFVGFMKRNLPPEGDSGPAQLGRTVAGAQWF